MKRRQKSKTQEKRELLLMLDKQIISKKRIIAVGMLQFSKGIVQRKENELIELIAERDRVARS